MGNIYFLIRPYKRLHILSTMIISKNIRIYTNFNSLKFQVNADAETGLIFNSPDHLYAY